MVLGLALQEPAGVDRPPGEQPGNAFLKIKPLALHFCHQDFQALRFCSTAFAVSSPGRGQVLRLSFNGRNFTPTLTTQNLCGPPRRSCFRLLALVATVLLWENSATSGAPAGMLRTKEPKLTIFTTMMVWLKKIASLAPRL